MKSELANVYAFLMSNYAEKHTISYAYSSTYLGNIVGSEEVAGRKVVFVRTEDRTYGKLSSSVSPTHLNINKPAEVDLDLTGSPLKDNCVIDAEISFDLTLNPITIWKPEEEFHKGLSVEKARKIICNETLQKQKSSSGSLWILCDAADDDKTLLLQYEFSPEHFSRGIVTFVGFVSAATLTTAQEMLHRHFSCVRAGSSIKTVVENVYQMKSDILIRCSFATSASMPALINLGSCDVSIEHKFRMNDNSPLTQDFVNQLRMLMCIREDIIAYRECGEDNAGKEPSYRCGRGIEMDDLREKVHSTMTEFVGIANAEAGKDIEYDIETVVHRAKIRRLDDLTDNLWNLLNRCKSYKDLKTAFQVVFQCAARSSIVNIPMNNNRLAKIITEISNHRLVIPSLTGSEPLELLLEIGLEKMYKDYEYIFTESKLCSPNSLKQTSTIEQSNSENGNVIPNVRKSLRNAMKTDAVTPRKTLLHNRSEQNVGPLGGGARKEFTDEVICFKNSNFDETVTETQLSKLLQIHCTLEHLLMIHMNLNFPNAYSGICEQLLSRPLKLIGNVDDSFVDQMDINISIHNVREHLEGMDPCSRRITFKSKNQFRHVKTVFFYNMENVCPPNISENFESEEKKCGKDNVYYCWLYQKIQTLNGENKKII